MRTRLAIAALIYPMVQAVLFGIGMVLLLAMSPPDGQQALMPWMIGVTVLLSVPIAWSIAPRLRLRFRRDRPGQAPD